LHNTLEWLSSLNTLRAARNSSILQVQCWQIFATILSQVDFRPLSKKKHLLNMSRNITSSCTSVSFKVYFTW